MKPDSRTWKFRTWKLLLALLAFFTVFVLAAQGEKEQQHNVADVASVEQRRLLVSLAEEQEKLEGRERRLAMKDLELKTLAAEVDTKLNELGRLRQEVQELLKLVAEEDSKRLQELRGMYEKMDPARAAKILNSLEQELAIAILAGMKKKAAANLLNNLEPGTAAALSTAFSTVNHD